MYTGKSYKSELECINGCTQCSLSNFRRKIVKYRGNPRSDVMFILQAPGRKEDEMGIPVVGPTGGYLVNIVQQSGLSLDNCIYINSVLCKPPNDDRPTETQLNACSDWLNLQIRLVNPKYIIATGNVAASRVVPNWNKNSRITTVEGNIYTPPNLKGIVVIPIRHPRNIYSNPASKREYEENIRNIINNIKKDIIF